MLLSICYVLDSKSKTGLGITSWYNWLVRKPFFPSHYILFHPYMSLIILSNSDNGNIFSFLLLGLNLHGLAIESFVVAACLIFLWLKTLISIIFQWVFLYTTTIQSIHTAISNEFERCLGALRNLWIFKLSNQPSVAMYMSWELL